MDEEANKSWQDYQIAWLFTLFYWLASIALALLIPNHPASWLNLRWLFAILFVAVPLTVLVWIAALFSNYLETPLSPKEFTRVCVGITVVHATLLAFKFF